MSQAGLLEVQHAAGNRAATAIVQRQPGGAVASERRTLRFGFTGEDVKQLQMKLRNVRERRHDLDAQRYARIDGIFGPLTRQDVIDFQGDTGLGADGIVGPKTWDALDSLVPGTPDEGQERAFDERNDAALDLFGAGQYDAALAIFEALLTTLQS
ncbi:MAG: peptidoglycan-binding domain-containing protein, partial [Chloroflexota bacterium]|nr:peptidoglycan-binding domain-containing protein [Chloroflexota bacterium]